MLDCNLFRKGYKLFKNEWLERSSISISPGAFIDFAGASERMMFDTARVTPLLDNGAHPDFLVHAYSKNGDYVKFIAHCKGHATQSLGRSILGGRVNTYWSYNEYMFRMGDLTGRVGDKSVNHQTMGNGFGNLEYTWGIGL